MKRRRNSNLSWGAVAVVAIAELGTAEATEVSSGLRVVVRPARTAASSVGVVTVIGISVPVEAIAAAARVATGSMVLLKSSLRS